MKVAYLLVFMACIPAFAQQPNVRLQKMSDQEYNELKSASDARENAAKAYFSAQARYEKIHGAIEEKYNAVAVKEDCQSKTSKDVEWKGQYLVIEEKTASPNDTMLSACSFIWTPTGQTIGTNLTPSIQAR